MSEKIIYIIDDDDIYQFTTKRLIEISNSNHKVVGIDNGETAIETLGSIQNSDDFPDIIFLDINMPEVDGWKFLELFRGLSANIEKTIRIFMVSSSTDRSDKDKARSYPEIEDYIVKPFNLEVLGKYLNE